MSTSQIKTLYIPPGSPWEQPYIESFHDKFRDECLNRDLFASLAEARIVIESWRREYNQERPHSTLGYLTPNEFSLLHRPATTSCNDQNGRLKTEDKRWAPLKLGSNARLTHNRLSPDRRAAATSRARPGHILSRHSHVEVPICELGGQPLDYPFVGAATMTVLNVAPTADGVVNVRFEIKWQSVLSGAPHSLSHDSLTGQPRSSSSC